LQGEVLDTQQRACRTHEIGILVALRLGQIAVHIGMLERVLPEDAPLLRNRRHKGLGVGDNMDLDLIEEGRSFLK